MNFCVDCKRLVKISEWYPEPDYYCRKPCDKRYDYITGIAITNTLSKCVDVRKNNPNCLYFDKKPPKWYKTILKKLRSLLPGLIWNRNQVK